ncbi:MAG: hypothetical protein A2W93_06390 [Bacteroidetes bacterium GWF2_43_63]|nr:MAG: hypothetical protein A2W94_08145 [Bacteroidetes bacterium GWE2_42_42]OFY53249.1 MAG: hypothetical protein A2W93_06390 [Bacteroidetes bacterium GWF2_43_63]HBG71759.1 hypothetical protein [Bacteroidales bacterium]HCB61576.1 hypothetical protein [Bacteroidales bacterium]HCY22788.1 hypothetical protein [Bacteroidales bacterium]
MRLFIFGALVFLSFCLSAQKATNYKKDIEPLLKEQKFDEALPLLKKFYNERLDKYGVWTNKAILQMDFMYLASENIAVIYFNKATSMISVEYADSADVWFEIMKHDDHPKKGNIDTYIEKLNDVKIKAAEIQQKKQEEERKVKERLAMAEIIDEIVHYKFVAECVEFEHVYYETKIYDYKKANEMYIVAKEQMAALGLLKLPIDIVLSDVPDEVEHPGTMSSNLYSYFDNRKKSLKYNSVSYQMDGNNLSEVSYYSQVDNQSHYYSLEPVQIADSSLINDLCTEKLKELNNVNKNILYSLLETARHEQYAVEAKKAREELLAANSPNEKIMLEDKTLPYASTKLCDYRDGRFVAYYQNNTVYRRHYSRLENSFGEWKATGSKILIRNGKKIFYRQKHYNEAVIEADGSVKIYTVSESTGERLSDHYYNYGYVNGNRFDSEADSKEKAEDGFLFKGSAIEAIIIVSLCNSFK